ncbi:alpha/beta fold hydrolase [Natronorarus salvus]|uniref:alpha/beta fold hydrolase n=1 Tax=Natronorarus salvus TaxID=3117733 RepID=UPI002F264722
MSTQPTALVDETEVEDGRVVVDGSEIHYLTAGHDGPAVILLHGGGLDSAAVSWRETLPALADGYQVFAPDLPGYGESAHPEAPYSIEYFAHTLSGFMDALNITHASLVGISMGGGIALQFALSNPDRVDRLVAVDSYGLTGEVPGGKLGYLVVRLPLFRRLTYGALRNSRRLMRASVRRMVGSPDVVTPGMVVEIEREAKREDAGLAFNRFQRAEVGWNGLRTEFSDRLHELSVPTLFVHGAEDTLVPPEASIRAATLAPDAELEMMEGVGHWPPRERPEEFAGLVREFLRGV